MATLEIFLSSTKALMAGTTKYKNGELSKSAFNTSMMMNLAYLLDNLNNQSNDLSQQQEDKNSENEEQQPKEDTDNKPSNTEEEEKNDSKNTSKPKESKLIDFYLPLSQLSYSIETMMQSINIGTNFKSLKNVMRSITTNFKGTQTPVSNTNNNNNINNNNNEDSPFNDIEFEQIPFIASKHIKDEKPLNENEEIDILNDDINDIPQQHTEFDILFTGEVNDSLFDNYNNISNKESLAIQNNNIFNNNDVDEMENELFNFLPEKKIETCNPNAISTAELEASNTMRYRKEVVSFIMSREVVNPLFSSRSTRAKIKKKNSFSSAITEFETYLSKKVIKNYISDMNDNYLRYMLFHYQKVKRSSENIIVCEEKMFLNLIKVFILEMGISDRKIYEDTLRNLVYKKKNYDFENFLSCFSKILKLKDENCVIKYKFLLYVTIMGEEKRLNKNHLKKYFELLRCSKVYDGELYEDISENLLLKYMSIYPGEKYVTFPLERIMLLIETFFDNR